MVTDDLDGEQAPLVSLPNEMHDAYHFGVQRWSVDVSKGSAPQWWLDAKVEQAVRFIPRSEHFELEHQFLQPDGGTRWALIRGQVTAWAGNTPICAVGIIIDIDQQKQGQAQLQRSYQQLRYHVENTPVATVEWNQRFEVLMWSSSAQQRFGWSAEEVVGKSPGEWRFVHEDDVATVSAQMAELASGSVKRAFLLNRNYTKDGEIRYTEWYTSALRDDATSEVSILSRALDVTDRELAFRALQDRQNELQGLADAIPHIVWTTTPQGETNFLNRRWSEYTGSPAVDDLSSSWNRSIHPDDLEGLAVTRNAALRCGEPFEGEIRFLRADRQYCWHLVRFIPVKDDNGQIIRWVGTATDIDDIHRLQGEMKKKTSELTRSNDVLQQLAYAAAHDLQEPIRTTGSFAGLLAKRCGNQLDTNGLEYLRLIQDGNARMASLVKSLLSYAQDSAGTLNFEAVPVDRVARQVVADLRTRIDETGAVVTWSELPVVKGDETQLARLVQNLVVNAIHYRHSDRSPVVTITAGERDSWHILGVHDNGIGIEARYCEQIFGLFKRLHGVSVAGSGIGLASCRQIAERHGGKIWVESVPGEGSSFFFMLPRL